MTVELTQKMVVSIFLVFECQSTIADMVKILQPLKVGNGDTTSVYIQVRYDEDLLLLQDFICFRCCWTVGSLGNNLISNIYI